MNNNLELANKILKVAKEVSATDNRPLCDQYDELAKNAKSLSDKARKPEDEAGPAAKCEEHVDALLAHDKAQDVLDQLKKHCYRAMDAIRNVHGLGTDHKAYGMLVSKHQDYCHLDNQHEKIKRVHHVYLDKAKGHVDNSGEKFGLSN